MEKISVILTRIQELQSVQLDQLHTIFKKIKKLRVVIKEDIEVFLFKEDEGAQNNPYVLMTKIDKCVIIFIFFNSNLKKLVVTTPVLSDSDHARTDFA